MSAIYDPTVRYFPPRLVEKLEYIKKYPLTLIEAPSGFGKTTLLEHFFTDRISPAIQVRTYDFESDSPTRCWHSICRQLERIDPECGRRLLSLGAPEPENLSALTAAVRSLSCPTESYLWLDNYKRWQCPCAAEFLDILTHHGGTGLHIVVSTQPLSAENWEHLQLDGRFWHLQGEDLTFTLEDTKAYFHAVGLQLPEEQVQQAFALTEGWIMALCLQVMCYVNRGQFQQGSMDDLMERIFWEKLQPQERAFLILLSVFPKFSLQQAAFLSELSLDETDKLLRGQRYFIHFDPESRCFYPHTQLRQLLGAHFAQLPHAQQQAVYLRAGQAAEHTRDRANTLRFYYLSGQWERFLSLPLTSYDVADVTDGDTRPMIVDILENTPEDVMLRHPQALIPLAFSLFFMGETRRMSKVKDRISDIIDRCTLDSREKDALRGELELMESFLHYNNISQMSIHHKRAFQLLDGPSRLISLKSTWTFGVPSVLYLYWRESGGLDRELDEMDRCMPVYYRLTLGHGSGAELIMRAEACLMRGQPDEALPLCYQALYLSQSRHQGSIYLCGLFLLCRIALQNRDMAQLENARRTLREQGAQNADDLCRYTLDLADGYLSLLLGHPEELAPWLARGSISEKRLVLMAQPFAFLLFGRYLLERQAYHQLLGVSQHFMGLSMIFPNLLPQVYAHIYCAQALQALGRQDEAVRRLQTAMDLAMPDGLLVPFAENFRGLSGLMPLVIGWHEQIGQIRLLSDAYRPPEETETGFTPREQSILALLRENLTNREIGEKLCLSPNTVRNIISGMLKKQNLASREQLRLL